jgi:hypothetical protein
VTAAKQWMKDKGPVRGLTDIMTPLSFALELLEGDDTGGNACLPFILLLTDGCVSDERSALLHATHKNTTKQGDLQVRGQELLADTHPHLRHRLLLQLVLPQGTALSLILYHSPLSLALSEHTTMTHTNHRQMLSQIGRGFSDVVLYPDDIYKQICQLIDMAAVITTFLERRVELVLGPCDHQYPLGHSGRDLSGAGELICIARLLTLPP